MVKGNWERRVEMAKLRREAKRGKKVMRAAGHAPDQVVSKILAADPEATVFLLASGAAAALTERHTGRVGGTSHVEIKAAALAGEGGGACEAAPLCRAHFEAEACGNRRCKFSHSCSIALFDRVGGGAGSAEDAADAHSLTVPAQVCSLGPAALLWPAAASRGLAAPGGGGAACALRCEEGKHADERERQQQQQQQQQQLAALPEPLLLAVLEYTDAGIACAAAVACASLRRATLASAAVDEIKRAVLPRLQSARARRLMGQAERVLFIGSTLPAFARRAAGASGRSGSSAAGARRLLGAVAHAAAPQRPTLVHDASDTSVWEGAEARAAARAAVVTAAAVAPCAATARAESAAGETAEAGGATAVAAPPLLTGAEPPAVLSALFAVLDDRTAACLLAGCGALRKAARADPAMRARRREGIERVAVAQRKRLKKLKKQSKKAACGKKDGFARGR
jgi:hypothetical protein